MRISKVSSDVNGEGKHTGHPTTFVHFEDPKNKKIKKLAIANIISQISKMKNTHVCLTGESPLEQEEAISVVYELAERGYVISISTSCSLPLNDVRMSRTFSFLVEVKCPSSGEVEKNTYRNLALLSSRDEIKFVINDIEDYVFAKDILIKYPTKADTIFTTDFNGGDLTMLRNISQWIVEDKTHRVRLGVPIDKLLSI